MRIKSVIVTLAILATATLSPSQASAAGDQPVLRFADGAVVGSSQLVRTPNGVSFNLSTTQLAPGSAYTLWVVVFNNPAECQEATPVSSCGPSDVANASAMPDVLYGAGHVAGASGKATLAGRRSVGDSSGSITAPIGLPAFGLQNPSGAEIHLVVHEHGPKLAGFMPDMIQTVAGGCTDAGIPEPGVSSPFNDYSGPEYGRRGPNTCRSIHFAVHQP